MAYTLFGERDSTSKEDGMSVKWPVDTSFLDSCGRAQEIDETFGHVAAFAPAL